MKTCFREENFSEDLFFGDHTIHLEIFCFEHSGRFFVPPQTILLSYGYEFVKPISATMQSLLIKRQSFFSFQQLPILITTNLTHQKL